MSKLTRDTSMQLATLIVEVVADLAGLTVSDLTGVRGRRVGSVRAAAAIVGRELGATRIDLAAAMGLTPTAITHIIKSHGQTGCTTATGEEVGVLAARLRDAVEERCGTLAPPRERDDDEARHARRTATVQMLQPDTRPSAVGAGVIETYTGRMVDVRMLAPESIDLEDLGYALGNLCRFNGHTRHFYSVAEHSLLVVLHLRRQGITEETPAGLETLRWGLLHDAAEAYLGDVPSPLKTLMSDAWRAAYELAESAVATFGGVELRDRIREPVKAADVAMLEAERRDLLEPADWPTDTLGRATPSPLRVRLWSPNTATCRWINEAERLGIGSAPHPSPLPRGEREQEHNATHERTSA